MPEWLKRPLLRLLRVTPVPAPPAGAPGTLLVFRAAPGFFLYRLVGWAVAQTMALIGAAFVLFMIWSATEDGRMPFANLIRTAELLGVMIVLLQVPVSFLILRLDFEMRWYAVTDRSLRIREGAWGVREMTMTFANVQNIEMSQGPLQRLLGIADLRVSSAGGAGPANPREQGAAGMHAGYFRGIANADEVRDVMRQRLRRYRDAGLGDTDEQVVTEAVPEAAAADLSTLLAEMATEARGLRAAAERVAAGG